MAADRDPPREVDPRWTFLGSTLWNMFLAVVGGVFVAALTTKANWLQVPDVATVVVWATGFVLAVMAVAMFVSWARRRSSARSLAVARPTVREQTAAEIQRVLEAVPPLQRKAVRDGQYIGRWARWSGTARIIEVDKYGDINVHVSQESGRGDGFVALVPKSERRTIESMREGDRVAIEGKIVSVHPWSIVLEDARVVEHAPPRPKAAGEGSEFAEV